MKLNRKILLLSICLYFLTGSVSAQKTLEKPLEKWSKEDALKIVTNSPWAQTYQSPESSSAAAAQQIRREQRDSVNSGGGNLAGSSGRSLGNPPVVIRLHSALPIRQAIIRGRQIAAGYDKMDDK